MKAATVSLSRHVHEALSPYRWATSVIISLLLACLFACFSLASRATSDQQLLAAIAPYLSTLVESQDRPEILRVLHSISENRGANLVLVQGGNTLASTRDISEMDRAFIQPRPALPFFGSFLAKDQLVSTAAASRQGGPSQRAQVYVFTPFQPMLLSATAIALLIFLGSILISSISARRLKFAIHGALLPLEELHRDIQSMSEVSATAANPLPIRELDDIRQTIAKTKLALSNALERLAEERAKQLNAASYKRLIHDLHNPTAALRQWIHLLVSPEADEEARLEAGEAVPRIADQILRQVTSAKRNLENEPEALRESDLRTCLQASLQQLRDVTGAGHGKQVTLALPDHPVIVAHDPALLQRAIANLVENGIEASRDAVEISLEKSGHLAIIRVSDNGNGMDETAVSLFLQGQGLSKKGNREAMGLSSTNHIVRTHGGKIVYRKSTLGGAAFEIRLEAL